ncbi:hypothetical protein DV096_12575 [Bradymonadaceae bacterium TMQ3]|uniref:Uncharacterized protein n=1 Tax=Lujinxingia sediminis TaxID=2480984 RepID=A0ABY0CQV3_9DELT|nr:hypothetical protein [Lujinxingia sediminis]RDV37935.1 hypothetical protein DV096_12575 [Bradymonadaceae bacterium TMQ3]RVU42737.1 hypothetical protein EA187_14580 [Lujinxingia sediminis]TXC75287.1 hypothetical protein FRC91_11210 [Bradymonadales bacterium TMQ1]
MGQLFAYVCSDDSLSGELMAGCEEVLGQVAPSERAGLGLAWAQGGRTLVRKQPGARAAGVALEALLSDVPSRAVVAHVRARDEGRLAASALQPFRAGAWVWTQEGFGPDDEGAYAAMREQVPEHLRQRLGGRALAEVMFLSAYAAMERVWKRASERERWRQAARAMADALERARGVVEGALPRGAEGGGGAAVAARDRGLIALAIDQPLYVRVVRGLEVGEERRTQEHVERVARERFRAVLVTSAPTSGAGPGWEPLGRGQALWVDESWEVFRTSLQALLPGGTRG